MTSRTTGPDVPDAERRFANTPETLLAARAAAARAQMTLDRRRGRPSEAWVVELAQRSPARATRRSA